MTSHLAVSCCHTFCGHGSFCRLGANLRTRAPQSSEEVEKAGIVHRWSPSSQWWATTAASCPPAVPGGRALHGPPTGPHVLVRVRRDPPDQDEEEELRPGGPFLLSGVSLSRSGCVRLCRAALQPPPPLPAQEELSGSGRATRAYEESDAKKESPPPAEVRPAYRPERPTATPLPLNCTASLGVRKPRGRPRSLPPSGDAQRRKRRRRRRPHTPAQEGCLLLRLFECGPLVCLHVPCPDVRPRPPGSKRSGSGPVPMALDVLTWGSRCSSASCLCPWSST